MNDVHYFDLVVFLELIMYYETRLEYLFGIFNKTNVQLTKLSTFMICFSFEKETDDQSHT